MTELRRIDQIEEVKTENPAGDDLRVSDSDVRYLLTNILVELRKMNLYLSSITDNFLENDDIENM